MTSSFPREDIILAHDYLIQMGGAERVVAVMAKAFPLSPIYTSRTDYGGLLEAFRESTIHNSWMQKIPVSHAQFKKLFPLYPFAFRSMRPSKAKAAWISASTFAKCIRLQPGTVAFCYCHAPTRFLWQTESYLKTEIGNPVVRALARCLIPWLRSVDRKAAGRMDYIIANSHNIKEQIKTAYGREADVIYPPVDVGRFRVHPQHNGHYLIVSRLIGYKGIDRAVRAFAGLDRELHIIGDGTDRKRLEAMAPRNVKFLGRVSDVEVLSNMENCRAFIFPGYEDFGITPVEAQACGKPVLAYGKGGALETVIHGETGIHFKEPHPDSLNDGLELLESITWDPSKIRKHAEKFSEERFLREMTGYMQDRLCTQTGSNS